MKNTIQKKTNNPDVIYTDQNGVTVTKLSFRVGQALYALSDISEYSVVKIAPNRKPSIFLIVLGATIVASTNLKVIPSTLFEEVPPMEAYGYFISPLKILEGIGIIILFSGLLAMLLKRSVHSLQINMGGNVIDTFYSKRRDYVKKIAVAVGIAIRNHPSRKRDNNVVKADQQPHSYANPNNSTY